MESKQILILNAVVYIVTFVVYQLKVKKFTMSSFVLIIYAFSASCAVDLFNSSNYHNRQITVFPFIYLYAGFLLMMYPLKKFSAEKITCHRIKKVLYIDTLSIIVIISIFVNFLFRISSINFSFFSNVESLATNYAESLQKARGYEDLYFSYDKIAQYLSSMFGGLSVFLLGYNLIYLKRKYITMGLFICLLIRIIMTAHSGGRGALFSILLDAVFVFLCFHKSMTKALKKMFLRWVSIFAGIIIIIFLAITIGRSTMYGRDAFVFFGDYAGQSFLNFNAYCLDAGGTREGDRIAQIVRLAVGLPISRNMFERIDKYQHMKIGENTFYTFVGDFTLDFGPIMGFLILIIISMFFIQVVKSRSYHFGHIFLIYILYRIMAFGIIQFPFYGIFQNIVVLIAVVLYFIFNSKTNTVLKKKI
jgi:oligosaccharide repeat unit polymerase